MCEPKRREVIEGWRKLLNQELHDLFSSLNIVESDYIREDEKGRTWYIPDSIRVVSVTNLFCVTNYPKCDFLWFPSHLLRECSNSIFR
jgi:hypothetical protein